MLISPYISHTGTCHPSFQNTENFRERKNDLLRKAAESVSEEGE